MATCPFCEYTGPSSSVEAHISGSRDESHKGRVGRDWRETVEKTVSDPSVPSDPKVSPGMALVLVTALFLAIVLLSSYADAGSEETGSDDQEDDSDQEVWA